MVGVAYQADHHPQKGCGWQGKLRELVWKDIEIWPLQYKKVTVFPKQIGALGDDPRELGWRNYDLRNIQHFGKDSVNNLTNVNMNRYDDAFCDYECYLFCSSYWWCENDVENEPQQRSFDIPVQDFASLERINLVYDVRGITCSNNNCGVSGEAVMTVNGNSNIVLRGANNTFEASRNFTYGNTWVHTSVEIPVAHVSSGTNSLTITITGELLIDRMQLEFFYSSSDACASTPSMSQSGSSSSAGSNGPTPSASDQTTPPFLSSSGDVTPSGSAENPSATSSEGLQSSHSSNRDIDSPSIQDENDGTISASSRLVVFVWVAVVLTFVCL